MNDASSVPVTGGPPDLAVKVIPFFGADIANSSVGPKIRNGVG